MNKMKKILTVGLCAVLCIALASCSMVQVNQERDAAQVVATVNGAEITKGDVNDAVDGMLSMYGMTQETYASSYGDTQLSAMKTSIVDEMIDQEMLFQKAKEEGLVDESDEHKAEVKEEIEGNIQTLKDSIRTQVEADEKVADADKESTIETQTEQMMALYGYDNVDQLVEDTIRTTAITDMKNKVNDEVTYTEDEARTFYDEQVAEQQPKVEEDPANYATYNSSSVAVVRPENSKYVKNLLLQIPSDVQAEIKQLRTDGDDAGADVKRDEALAEIKSKADAALARAKAGEDFDALIEELGEDTGMKSEPAKTEGYLVYKGSGMVQPFEDASLALANPGDISDLVVSDYGYHIIQNVRNADGVIPFDEIKDDIIKKKLAEAQSAHLTEKLTEWKDAADIKTDASKLG